MFEQLKQPPERSRGLFCNRTLNFRAIRAIGYDMDYTLIHYRVSEWERHAYEHTKQRIAQLGLPVDGLAFEPERIMRGIVIDTELGNLVKANRFGFIKQAFHGTRPIEFEEQRNVYARVMVDLAEPRWMFLNTLFSLSEACLYAQLVDRLDEQRLPTGLGYNDLYRLVRASVDEAHLEGQLKAEIVADPARFVELDPEVPLTLLDQQRSKKKLVLITNSDWAYTRSMMSYAFDPFLPKGTTWRDLFALVIVDARKPAFFSAKNPVFEVVTDDGLLRPVTSTLKAGGIYLGGHAGLVERLMEVDGDQILYVGDHMYGDVHFTKSVLRWRTALILRELEDEVTALEAAEAEQSALESLMQEKESLEYYNCQLKLQVLRIESGYGPVIEGSLEDLTQEQASVRQALIALDDRIAPLARLATRAGNPHWGLLMRAGNDKSHLARQVERYADIYTSRVSNFLYQTPFRYLRSIRGSVPHDL